MKATVLMIGGALAAALTASSAGAASMDLSKDIHARGAKPDWTLKITGGTQVTLTRPGKPALQARAPGAAISPAGATLSAKAADGQAVQVTLKGGACTVGAKQYPMSAQVKLGAETLTGCAGYTP